MRQTNLEPLGPALSAADAAWLKMDEPTNPMTITAALLFDELPSAETLNRFIQSVTAKYERLRQRVVFGQDPLRTPHWQTVADFESTAHIFHSNLETGREEEIRERLSALMSTPLEPDRPLWALHALRAPGGGGVLVARIQHSIGDGVSLVSMLESMQATANAESTPRPEGPSPEARRPRSRRVALGRLVKKTVAVAQRPGHLAALARETISGTSALGKTVLLPPDPPTLLKRPLTTKKRCAWSRPIPLTRLKALASAVDGTINDVLMAALTGAVRRYLIEQREDVSALEIRTLLTVNLRPPESMPELGNRFGLVFLPLPVSEAWPGERLRLVKARMDAIKASREAPMILYLLGAAGAVAPREVEHELVGFFGKKASLVVTNLKGPDARVTFAGKKVSRILVWAPQSGRLGLGVSILSYAGDLTVGVASDLGVIGDPETLTAGLELELEALEREVLGAPEASAKPQAGVSARPRAEAKP